MKVKMLIGSVATLAALAVAGCKDDTAQYVGGPAGPAVTMLLSKASFTMPDGGASSVAAQVLDSAGNVAGNGVTFASCNSAIVAVADSATAPTNWAKAATVTAKGVGTSCITATSDNGIVDTAQVTIGPATLVITGKATISSGLGATCSPFGSCAGYFGTFGQSGVGDTLSSRVSVGATALPHYTYYVTGYNAGGTALAAGSFFHQWGSVDSALLRPWSRSADSVFVTQPGHLGNTRLVVTAVGGATAVFPVSIIPDTFTKTGATLTVLPANITTTPALDTLHAIRCVAGAAAGTFVPAGCTGLNPAIGSRVFVDGVETFLVPRFDTTTIGANKVATGAWIVMPPITHASQNVPVLFGNMGTLNTAAASWEFGLVAAGANATTTTDPTDPLNDSPATTTAVKSAGAASLVALNFYGTLQGANCVDNATNPGTAGQLDCLDWISFTNTDAVNAHPVSISLLWLTDADLDMAVFDNAGTTDQAPSNGHLRGPGAFNAAGESIALTLAKSTTVKVRVRFHSAGTAPVTLYRVQFLIS